MDARRVGRYLAKVDHARDRLGLVESWLPSVMKDVQVRLATYKAFQEAAERR